MYKYDSPLIDASSRILREIEREEGMSRHQMPQVSGVENPITVYQSESFFRLAKDHWEVSPVEDPDLATNLIKAFKPAKLSLRDQIIVRMALESGARIREILQLTVGDWRKLGGKQEARACSKGSRGRRVKRIRFSDTTAKMLRQYLNTDRAALDPELRRLEQLADQDSLFLSQRHKPFDYEAFKPHWKKLCYTAKVQLRIHDLRHWYVSMSMRIIAESAKTSAEIVLRKEELVRYMAWRSSDTIATYEKYFKGIQHYPIQDQVHQQLNEEVSHYLRQKTKKSSKQQERSQKRQGDIPQQITSHDVEAPINPNGWERLLALGGMQ
jgi:integrase